MTARPDGEEQAGLGTGCDNPLSKKQSIAPAQKTMGYSNSHHTGIRRDCSCNTPSSRR
jgi:hypothetical protein